MSHHSDQERQRDPHEPIMLELSRAWLGLSKLARLELGISISHLPDLAMLWILRAPALLLVWCSFSALFAWSVYEFMGSALAGFTGLFFLQCLMALGLGWMERRVVRQASLPLTREYMKRLMNTLEQRNEPL